jgi:hypothetical protein
MNPSQGTLNGANDLINNKIPTKKMKAILQVKTISKTKKLNQKTFFELTQWAVFSKRIL